MPPDAYTTTNDPLRHMVCFYCKGMFVGDSHNEKFFHGQPITLCDNCLRSAADA